MLIKCRLNVVGLNMLVIGWNNIGLVNLKNMGPCLDLFVGVLTSLCHSNGHIETMPAREINPFTALTRIRTQVSQDTMIDEQSQRVDTTTH